MSQKSDSERGKWIQECERRKMMFIFKAKKIIPLSSALVLAVMFLVLSVSCRSDTDHQDANVGVISLFDSLGVKDVPSFPGSKLDKEMYRNMDTVLQELPDLPEMFADSIFFPYITKKTQEEVSLYYYEKMEQLSWDFVEEYDYGAKGIFMTWQKMTNTGIYITYGIFAGNYIHENKTSTLILRGFIIPEDES